MLLTANLGASLLSFEHVTHIFQSLAAAAQTGLMMLSCKQDVRDIT